MVNAIMDWRFGVIIIYFLIFIFLVREKRIFFSAYI